ncbi:MAG: hypothetical protein JNM14_05555 [Ferruginibacter sp.]|nr:hypothetical protein [Ferruginibacter sp.]
MAICSEIICYCLMPNHFHIIIQANEKSVSERGSFGGKPMQEFAYRVGILLSSYSQAINKQNKTTGSLFQQKTKVKILSEQVEGKQVSYAENCFFYIHNNPLRAGLTKDLKEWQWSSYPDYIGVRKGTLCNKELFFEITDLSKGDIINRSDYPLEESTVAKFY